MENYNRLIIDSRKIAENLGKIPGRVMPMVKGNGYGLGMIELTELLVSLGVDIVGVAHLSEAERLRASKISSAIYLVAAIPEQAEAIQALNLEVAVGERATIEAFGNAPLHLDINTGLNRFGCRPEEALALAQEIPHLAGIATHVPSSQHPEKECALFLRVIESLRSAGMPPPWIHTGRLPIPCGNMTRVGLSLYEGALTLESRLVKIHTCYAGEGVGYEGTYRVTRPQERIGVVAIGYHDGVPYQLSGKGHVLVHGKEAPHVGRICMDFMMVDLTDIPEARIGDTVTIFSPQLSPQAVAGWAHLNVRSLLSQLGPRVQRHWEKHDVHLRNPLCTFEKDPPSQQHLLST